MCVGFMYIGNNQKNEEFNMTSHRHQPLPDRDVGRGGRGYNTSLPPLLPFLRCAREEEGGNEGDGIRRGGSAREPERLNREEERSPLRWEPL